MIVQTFHLRLYVKSDETKTNFDCIVKFWRFLFTTFVINILIVIFFYFCDHSVKQQPFSQISRAAAKNNGSQLREKKSDTVLMNNATQRKAVPKYFFPSTVVFFFGQFALLILLTQAQFSLRSKRGKEENNEKEKTAYLCTLRHQRSQLNDSNNKIHDD